MIIKRTIGTVALAVIAAVGYGDESTVRDGAEREVDDTSVITQCALDLSEGWTVTGFGPMDVPYSAVGWGIEESGVVGATVTLELTPVAVGGATVVASGLTGRGTNRWDTGGVRNDSYVLQHFVVKNGVVEPIETLKANLVFDRSAVRPLETLAAVAEAVFPDGGRSCTATAMGGANWLAVGFAGDGIGGPAAGTVATLTLTVDGIGVFAFDYTCSAGESLTVSVDDGAPQPLAVATDWTAASLAFGVAGAQHTLVISASGRGTAVRGVTWDTGRASGSEPMQCSLDLSDIWDKRNLNPEPIRWSSLGWDDAAEAESGKAVTLKFKPLPAGEEQTLMEPQAGFNQTFVWMPGEVSKQVYNIKHVITGGSPLEADLNAYFSFEHYDHIAPSEVDVRAAIVAGDGITYGFMNDPDNWWELIGGAGEGIEAPMGTSEFVFTVDGHGTFDFDYTLGGCTWTVWVDGVQVKTLGEAADWTTFALSIEGMRAHTVVFSTDLSAGSDFAMLKNVRWVDEDWRSRVGQSDDVSVDLRTNEVLVVKRKKDLLPFAWSSTNFTGVIEIGPSETRLIDPASIARVRVVKVTGSGDDLSQWTTEDAKTEKVLISKKAGEGTVKWFGVKPGVWKAEFTILTGEDQVFIQRRILDLRNYVGPGFAVFVF